MRKKRGSVHIARKTSGIFSVELWQVADECLDDFRAGATVGARAATEKAAREQLAQNIERNMQELERQLACESCVCADSSQVCRFDYAPLGDPRCEKEPDRVTVKYGKRVPGKWVCRQNFTIGCFCVARSF